MIRFLNPLLFFLAFILLLLVSVSMPVTKSLKWFTLTADFTTGSGFTTTGVTGGVSFGNWGWCTAPLVVEVLSISHTDPGECSNVKLGWTIDQRLVDLLHLQDLEDAVHKGLTAALVLNPVACGVTFIAFLIALWFAFRQTRLSAFIGVGWAVLASLLTTIAFIIDLAAMKIIKHNIEKVSSGFHVTYGSTTWLTMVAMILDWVATIFLCVNGIRGRRHQRNKEVY